MKFSSISKVNGKVVQDSNGREIVIHGPSVIRLKVSPEKVARYERRGEDLVLVLSDGEEVLIKNFFVRYSSDGEQLVSDSDSGHAGAEEAVAADEDVLRNDLLLEDENGVLWWGQYPEEWTEFHFTEIEWNDAGFAAWPWLLGALAGVGGVALAAGGKKNAPPVALDDRATGEEDGGPITGNVLGNDSDPDNDPLTVTGFSVNGKNASAGDTIIIDNVGTITIKSNGDYVFTPAPNYHGNVPPIHYTISDGNKQANATLNITVTPVVDLVADHDSNETDEDTPVNGTVVDNDSTTSGGALTFEKATDPANGTVVMNPNGSYTYTPNPNYHGTDSFTYTVTDPASGETLTKTVTIEINPVDDLDARDDEEETDEDTAFTSTVAGNDSTTSGGQLTFEKATDPSNGTVVMNPDGSYTYTPNLNFNGTDSFTYIVTDPESGEEATKTVTIVVNPVNDAPVISEDDAAEDVVEASLQSDRTIDPGTPTASGSFSASDVDGDDLTWSVVAPDDNYGTFSIDPVTGAWTYELDNDLPAVEQLNAGDTVELTFTVQVSDGNGGTDSRTVTITITGANDAPVATDDTGTVVESGVANVNGDGNTPVAGTSTATGNVLTNDTDVDDGEKVTLTAVPQRISGLYGDLVLNADGSYTYTLDNSREATQKLPQGEVVYDEFTYVVRDVHGATDRGKLTITVTGTNDRPVIDATQSDLTGAVTERGVDNPAAPQTATGTLVADDIDKDATQTWSIGTTQGTYGSIAIDPDTGDWVYAINNNSPATQALNKGETRTETFTARVTDEHGAYSEKTITITITGSNDAPVATNDTNTAMESGVANVGGNGNTPVAGKSTATGNVLTNDSDIDAGEKATLTAVPQTISGLYGDLVLNADGSYTYTLDNSRLATQALKQGQEVPETFNYVVRDVHGATGNGTLTITVTGTNDRPVIDAAQSVSTGAVTERGVDNPTAAETATGTLVATDVDAEATQAWSLQGTAQGTYGAITLNPATGEWVYTLNNALPATQALAKGDTRTETFTARVTDEHGAYSEKTITITITGSNDAPVATNDTNTATESGVANVGGNGNTPVAGKSTATGNVLTNDSDIDVGETATLTAVPQTYRGTYGDFVLNADGSYTYTLDNSRPATQALAQGATVEDELPYQVQDVHGGTGNGKLVITVTGTNDRPVIDAAQSVSTGAVTERGVDNPTAAETATGTLVATDVDAEATQAWSLQGTAQGTYGAITLNPATGEWVYTLNNALPATQALAKGDTRTETFTARVTDEHGAYSEQTITITITGSNDAPVATNDTNTAMESGVANVGGNGNTPVAGKSIATGNVLTNDSDIDAGEMATLTAVPQTISGLYGDLVLNADGSYTYTLDNSRLATQALKQGQEVPETFNYVVRDVHGGTGNGTLTITVTGTNDRPAIDGAQAGLSGSVTEWSGGIPPVPQTATGTVVATDVDGVDQTWSIGTTQGTYGSIVIDPETGEWTYTLDHSLPATQALREGEARTETFIVRATDEHGAYSERPITIVVSGSNDAPVAVDDVNDVTESGVADVDDDGNTPVAGKNTATGNVLTNDIDVDAGEKATLTAVPQTVNGTYGTLTLNADGSYTYTLDNSLPATQALKPGDAPTEEFNYTVRDVNGATGGGKLVITVNGTNDRPVIDAAQSILTGAVTEQGADNPTEGTTVSGTMAATDVDAGDTKTWTIGTTQGTYGSIAINPATGAWTYTIDNSLPATQALNTGQSRNETFIVRVTDGFGGYDEQTITITVHGSNDRAQIIDADDIVLDEDGEATGNIRSYIVDLDDPVTVTGFSIDTNGDGTPEPFLPGATATITDGAGNVLGTVTMATDGAFSFVPAPNYSGPVPELTYTVSEGAGFDLITQSLTFVITPVSDAPTLADDKTVDTPEDVSVALGLVAPVITDTGTGTGTVDRTERLGAITLTVGGEGASGVTFDMGGTPLTPMGGVLTIVLIGGTHVDGLPAHNPAGGVYHMTTAQYLALKAVPAAESGKNFTVTVDVTSYEVDASGNIRTDALGDPIPGASSSQTITVDVQAVTDGATLNKVNDAPVNPTIEEDGTYTLSDQLQVTLGNTDGNSGPDADGSETYWYEITGLPVGSTITIDGEPKVITSADQVVTSAVSTSAEPPSMVFTPPPHYSGELGAITVTLKSQDTDADSPDHTPDITESSVQFVLDVLPIADDVSVGGVTTPEDTAVNFLAKVTVTDTNGGGEEVINKIIFTIPEDWVVTAPTASAGWTYSLTQNGEATITFLDTGTVLTQAQREAILDGFTIKPPAHSSLDETITLKITTTDKATINGAEVVDSKTEDHDLKITVTPVAEGTDVDSDNKDGFDVTMTDSHEYDVTGKEDQWFALGTNYKDAANTTGGFAGLGAAGVWTNSDSDEFTYAVLTPELTSTNDGDSVIGTTFRFSTDGGTNWITKVYDGTPVWIPAEYLDTLQVKLPADVSGTLNIGVQAGTVDFDDDFEKHLSDADKQELYLNPPVQYGDPAPGETLGDLSSSNPNAAVNASGSENLTMIEFDPVADDVTMALNGRASGLEDTEIPLSIHTKTSDPSETIDVTIDNIPIGATITYIGVNSAGAPVNVTFTASEGDQSLLIKDFNNSAKLTITPPAHSNKDFTLNVSAVSKDGDSILQTPVSRDILVQVQGVADQTTVVLSNSGSVTEEALDSGDNKIALSEFVTTVTSPDTDGSETLTLRITGLDERFSIEGATLVTGGDGTERVWSIPVPAGAENPFDGIFVVLPPNFSGKVSMEVAGVSTENDGDSLTGARLPNGAPLIVTKDVIPSIDSIITTKFELTEDMISPVDLKIVHQYGDTDEVLTEIYIPVDYNSAQYQIYLGTTALEASGLTLHSFVEGGVTYYVIPADKLPTLGIKPSENMDGKLIDLPIKYKITDPATLGPLAAGTEVKDEKLSFTVKPVTDPVELDIADIDLDPTKGSITRPDEDDDSSRFTVNVTQSGTVTVTINATSDDNDGSEQVTRVLIQNVPEGVTINGASMIGSGEWLLILPAQDPSNPNANMIIDGNGQSIDLEFVVGIGTSAGLSDIKITVQTQDRGTAEVEEDEINFKLDVNLGDGGEFAAPSIDQWTFTPVPGTEDTRFVLDQVIDGKVTLNDTGAKHLLAITLTDLPDGTKVEYGPDGQLVEVQRTFVADPASPTGAGKYVWTIAVEVPVGGNGQSVLDQMLQDIRITPPANSNDNQADFTLDAQLKVVVIGGPSVSDKVTGDVPITPVTDTPVLSITTSDVDEGSDSIRAVITGGPSADDNGNATIVGDKVYVKVTATGNPGGTVSKIVLVDDGDGNIVETEVPLVLQTVTDLAGVPDGQYYVIDNASTSLPVTLEYSPPADGKLALGNVVFDAIIQSKENGASNTETTTANGKSEVKLANNGTTITVADASGNEALLADKTNAIQLTGLSVELNDSSELIKAIMLTGVPVGFLIYTGADASSATLAGQASNAGGNQFTNTWILGENGELPPFIAILPPAHWSGTIDDLRLIVASGETALKDTRYDNSGSFSLEVASRPDGITIAPTNSFGVEGSPILLNLNAAMVDNAAALAPVADSSTETTTLQIRGLGEHAAFYVDNSLYGSVTYDADTDVYTITGLTQAQLDKLAVVQAASAISDVDKSTSGFQVEITAWTVESATGEESAKVKENLNLAVTPVMATTVDDKFIWGDHAINGKAGIDTVSLRVGEDVSHSDLASKLKNIEKIDLSVAGANGISGGLTLADVVSITGKSNGTLTILGDADDFITLSTGSGWTTTGIAQDGYVAYTSGNATLLIDEDILATNITFV